MIRSMTLCTAFLAALCHVGPLSASVVSPWLVNPANGHRYALLSNNSWAESEIDANLAGGHLVTINDDALIYINGHLVVTDTDSRIGSFGPLDVTNYLVDGENLIAVKAHDSVGSYEGLSLGIFGTAVPEPSTLVLLGISAAALLSTVRIRRWGKEA